LTAGTRLSALDATFLELEQADPSAHMHIGGVMVFGRAAGAPPPTIEALRDRVAARSAWLPRYAERLSDRRSAGLRRPHWVDDPAFDLSAHVRREALPRPAGPAELLAWAGGFYGQRLDRRRPLWELVLIEHLAGGGWALATKLHHCLTDGMGSLDVTGLLADDPGPAPVRAAAAPAPPWPAAGLEDLLAAVRHPRRTLASAVALADVAVRDELVPAAACSLNVPIGEHRRLAVARARLDDLRAVRAALGGTVNDVVLAGVAGGLRTLLLARGEQPPARRLRAMVPVDVRPPDGAHDAGNRVSSLFVELPVGVADPAERFERVRAATAAAKAGRAADGASALLSLGERVPPVLHAVSAQALFGRRLFNLTVTNLPGSAQVLSAFGSPLREIVPVVPLAAEHAVGIAVLSYAGEVVLAVNADHDTVPDAGALAAGIEAELEALLAYARAEEASGVA
jgi:WS/DGAT/MGAT family acyltransferase